MAKRNAIQSRGAEVADVDQFIVSPQEEAEADAFEQRTRAEGQALLKKLKFDASAIYGLMHGGPGLQSPEKWAELLEQAGDELGNGRFLVRTLGAERYQDPRTVAVLLTLRQNLLAECERPTAVDVMLIDGAVLSYYNMLRAQGWIGNLALQVEADMFGNDVHSPFQGERTLAGIEERLRRLNDIILPVQDRANKMMTRNLAELRCSNPGRAGRRRAARS